MFYRIQYRIQFKKRVYHTICGGRNCFQRFGLVSRWYGGPIFNPSFSLLHFVCFNIQNILASIFPFNSNSYDVHLNFIYKIFCLAFFFNLKSYIVHCTEYLVLRLRIAQSVFRIKPHSFYNFRILFLILKIFWLSYIYYIQ